jgi:hypothetical protein
MFTLFILAARLAIGLTVALTGFVITRRFVENRLRYVDAIQNPLVPFVVGAAATIVAIPIVAILPFVGLGTAIVFGIGVFTGVASGAREIRKRLGAG